MEFELHIFDRSIAALPAVAVLSDRFWPEADPENWSFAVVKASALEKSRH